MAEDLDYVPMPDAVVKQIEETWKQVKGSNGQPVWTGSAS
jgi:phosphate transport system substrate-binding protein